MSRTTKNEIVYELVRGVSTYKCTCNSQKVRPYAVITDDENGEEKKILNVICLGCGATMSHQWEELKPPFDFELSVDGAVDEKSQNILESEK